TITIIAILGAIAFTAFNGFQSSARDSSRASDLANLSQALDTSYIKTGSYPNPDNSFTVTYSGGSLWYQGTVGDTLINILSSNGSKLSKKPTDPLTPNREYTYSRSAYGNTYELSSNWEGDRVAYLPHQSLLAQLPHLTSPKIGEEFAYFLSLPLFKGESEGVTNSLIPQVYAASNNPTITYIKGNYNGMVAKTVTGSVIHVIATPSLTTSTGTAGSSIDVTTLSGKLLYHGQTNSGGISYTPTLIYSSGSLPTNDTTGQITTFTTNLKTAYSGSVISANSNISNVLTTTGATNVTSLGASIITNYLGGSASAPPPPPATSYSLSNSLLFDSASAQYLSRTPSVAGSPNKWTWSGWVKRGKLGTLQALFMAGSDSPNPRGLLEFEPGDTIRVGFNDGTSWFLASTTNVFRDPSSWYHIVLKFDLDNDIIANRVVLYMNNIQQTITSVSWPNANQIFNNNITHRIGAYYGATPLNYFDGYLADVNFVDSGALDPTSFGQFDSTTNQWLPKAYTGTYGTNGFHLDFSSGASLGKDANGTNDWTVNGGMTATNNQVIDTPLNNFATLNPLSSYVVSPINGNLGFSGLSAGGIGSIGVASGKYYWESVYTAIGSADGVIVGIRSADSIGIGTAENVGYYGGGVESGKKTINGGISSAYGATWTIHDVIGVALDLDAGTVTFYKNNVSQGIISFTVGGKAWTPFNWRTGIGNSTNIGTVNFGQKAFTYTPPSGFKALSTANLPPPAIVNPKLFFDVLTYTGNHPSSQTLTGLSFSPDFVWIKGRDYADFHTLYDTIRGATKSVSSEQTTAEVTRSNALTAFTSNGFSLGGDTVVNYGGHPLVAWNWKKGTTPGFDIVSYTGSSSNTTIAHGLNTAPKMIIVKGRTNLSASTMQWDVWHTSLAGTELVVLNSTGAKYTQTNVWNSTAPGINTFSLGNAAAVNYLNDNYIAYLWSEVPGFSKFGSYTGNGSSDGPFVYTGFRPRYVMVKRSDISGNWAILDTDRSLGNPISNGLSPNLDSIEFVPGGVPDILSNGFKIRGDATKADWNATGGTYIYAAFAEAPFKYANAR
ncbi:MAG: hypothetical protein Q8K26_02645, partial [Candidatus Gracilibacteria bacterium]|nr:hypothetical protein [Candidatus Gracilibacteria bacterium]